jgi:hypothetical protein
MGNDFTSSLRPYLAVHLKTLFCIIDYVVCIVKFKYKDDYK